MAIFNKVDFVRAWCYKILPLVYDDSLSYYEVLCKTTAALNDVIENVNNLPEFIADLIEKFITSGAIDEVVREILANYILNVKYPPKGITPAVGDGTADDSAAIQDCIDYAAQNGYGAVYFPYGKYLTSPITLKSNVGLYGFDRYSTSIICKGGASAPLFSGNVENVSFANLTLDGNDGFQVNDIDLINATVNNMLLVNLIFSDASRHLVIAGNGGHLQIDNIVFNDCVINAATISGNIDVQAKTILFNQVSQVRGTCAVQIDSSGGVYDFISKATVPVGMIITGNNNTVNASIDNAVTPYNDTGVGNNIVINGKSVKQTVTGDIMQNAGGNVTKTFGGNYSITIAQKMAEQITDDRETTVGGNVTETITGNKGENITGGKTETISGDKKTNAANLIETYAGDKSTQAYDITETATGNYTRDVGEDYTENIKGAKVSGVTGNVTETVGGASSETVSGKKSIVSDELVLNPTQPLEYPKNETVVNRYFKGLPIKDADRDTFLLVPGDGNIESDINKVKNLPYFAYFFTPYCVEPEYYPQGTCLIDDNTMVCFYSDNSNTTNTAVLQKIDIETGNILLSRTVPNAYHGNALTYIPETNEIYTVRYYEDKNTGASNQIIVFNPDTLTISRSFTIAGVDSISFANYQNGKLYFADRATFVNFYVCNLDGTNVQKLFTSTFSTTWISYVDKNLNVWYTNGFNMIVCADLTGNVLATYKTDQFSADYATSWIELESIMELSDGTMLFADIAYRRTAQGIFRRHVVTSLNKSIVKGQPINWNIRTTAVMPALSVRPTYQKFQNGYGVANAYDSIEYAIRMSSLFVGSLVTIDGGGSVFDEWVVARSNQVIFLNNMTIQGMVVDYSTVSTNNGLVIKAGCADKVQAYVNVPRPTCLALWRWARFITNTGTIDGENKEGVNGCYQGYMCQGRFTYGRIINCAMPMYGVWSEPSTFGGNTIDFTGDIISNQYNLEQYGNYLFTRFGSAYGRKTKTLTGVNLGNWTPQKFNAKNFLGQMLSMVVNGNTYTFDLTAGTRCLLYGLDGTTPVYVQFTATVTNAEDGATLNLSNFGKVPTNFDLTKWAVTKVALW